MSTFYCDLELYDDCMICGSRHELRLLDDGQSICATCAKRLAEEEEQDEWEA